MRFLRLPRLRDLRFLPPRFAPLFFCLLLRFLLPTPRYHLLFFFIILLRRLSAAALMFVRFTLPAPVSFARARCRELAAMLARYASASASHMMFVFDAPFCRACRFAPLCRFRRLFCCRRLRV